MSGTTSRRRRGAGPHPGRGATRCARGEAQHMRRIWSIGMVALGLALGASVLVTAEQAQDASKIDANMKVIGPAFGALRKGLEGGTLDLVKTNGAALSKAFGDTESFFKSH